MQTEQVPLRVSPLPRPVRGRVERRKRRSTHTADALEFALEAAARRCGLEAVLLVNNYGEMVAQSETRLDLSVLAAVTPIVGRGRAIPRVQRKGEPLDFRVAPVVVGDDLLFVGALGGSRVARSRALRGVTAAAARILSR